MVSPFKNEDISDWPISSDIFYKYLSNVESIMPISSSSDNLDKFYNVKIGKEHDFKLSHAGNIFSRNVKKKKIT